MQENSNEEGKEILESIIEKMEGLKPLPEEFTKVIEEEFWNLL